MNYSFLKSAFLAASFFTLASCSSSYPDGIIPDLAEDFQMASVQYFSPSMIQSIGEFDDYSRLAPYTKGVYDVKIFRYTQPIPEGETDSITPPKFNNKPYPSTLEIAEKIDQLNLKSVIPLGFNIMPNIQVVSSNPQELKVIDIIILNHPEISIYEIRGENLKENLSQVISDAMNGDLVNFPNTLLP